MILGSPWGEHYAGHANSVNEEELFEDSEPEKASAMRQGSMTSGNLNTVPAMGRTTLTCWCFVLGSRSK